MFSREGERKSIMVNFTEVAKKVYNQSPVMVGNKLTTAQLINSILTITGADIIDMVGKPVSVWNFKEFPGHYFGGKMLTEVLTAWEKAYTEENGAFDLTEFNKELKSAAIKIKLETTRLRNGNAFVKVSFVK